MVGCLQKNFDYIGYMKKLTTILLIMGLSILQNENSNAQNLVPNFGFEDYTPCPTAADQISFCDGWSKFSISFSSPDYYNACSPATSFGVPNSVINFQLDHRNCGAYAGLVTRGGTSNDREHIGIQLDQQLLIGQKYFVSFYTVLGGEKPLTGDYYAMPSNNIGVRLSTVSYSGSNPCPINNWAHLNYSSILNDSINWTHVSGSIIADSAYNYLIVGNFFDDANTDTMNYNCSTCLNEYSYYLIDDVCLSTDSLLCNGGIDALPCFNSLNDFDSDDEVDVFPNPSFDFVNFFFRHNKNIHLTVFNQIGEIIYLIQSQNEKQIILDISSLSKGVYYVLIQREANKIPITKKIIKI